MDYEALPLKDIRAWIYTNNRLQEEIERNREKR